MEASGGPIGAVGGSLRSSRQLDSYAKARGPGETPIAREKRSVERFGERNVNGVVGGEVVPQLPNWRQQKIVRIPSQGKVRQVGERRGAAFPVDVAVRGLATDRLSDLDVEQMRGVQRFPGVEQSRFDRLGRRRAQQRLDHRRGVDDDHRRSRSRRTASAGATEGVTGRRCAKRARSSSSVGRSAVWRVSPSRRSDSDMPAIAARALSRRCSASGTWRIWIITDMPAA